VRVAVLVGDHRQLPPLFQEGDEARSFMDEVEENEAANEEEWNSNVAEAQTLLTRDNLRRFEKMVTASLFKSHFEMADDSNRARLNVQFRMHPQIMAMVNHFYEGQLECGLLRPDDPDPKLRRVHGLTLKSVTVARRYSLPATIRCGWTQPTTCTTRFTVKTWTATSHGAPISWN
jgi:hypothetical protein